MEKKHDSALKVMAGIEQPGQINAELVNKLKSKRVRQLSLEDFVAGICDGNRMILSKAITLIESSLHKDQELAQEIIAECLKGNSEIQNPKSEIRNLKCDTERTRSIRIGITGVPGVGKSTFIEALGKYLTGMGHKLAVLAIDPSSTRSKGSILGDKTRMEELSVDYNAFIRPSPSAGSLGGVARKTRETILLCEAAGFDVIFIETVGVGQSETAVHSMVDFFLLLMLAGAGDELQGIKRGIIEMADAIFINKADGENVVKANAARVEYSNALHLFPPPESGWIPVVDICSARSKQGIDKVWETIVSHQTLTIQNGYFEKRRKSQNRQVLYETIETELRRRFFSEKEIATRLHQLEKEIEDGKVNPYKAGLELVNGMMG